MVGEDGFPPHPYGDEAKMHPRLRGAVYAGICISGSAVEVSQIKIWKQGNPNLNHTGAGLWDYRLEGDKLLPDGTVVGTGTAPYFWTPDTTPAYVPVQSFKRVSVTPSGSGILQVGNAFNPYDADLVVFNSANVAIVEGSYSGNILIQPEEVTPAWREDGIYYQFFYLGVLENGMYDAFEINGNPLTSHPIAGIGETFENGHITIDTSGMTGGQVTVGRFKIVARDLELDRNKNAIDYSLLQTLAEYNFLVELRK